MRICLPKGREHNRQNRYDPDSPIHTKSRVPKPSNEHGAPCPEKPAPFPRLYYGWPEDRRGCRLPPCCFLPGDELPAAELLFVPHWLAARRLPAPTPWLVAQGRGFVER